MPKEEFRGKMARVYCSQKDQWEGQPLHAAILSACAELKVAGATVFRGVEGFGASAHLHHASVWPPSNDPPLMITIVAREEQITRLLARIEGMLKLGFVVISDVQIVQYSEIANVTHTR